MRYVRGQHVLVCRHMRDTPAWPESLGEPGVSMPVLDPDRREGGTKKPAMKTKVGLWIDHRRAVVVTTTDKAEEIASILSGVERHLSRYGDSPRKGSFEARQVPADDSRQRAFTGRLNVYYDAVIGRIGDAESILIFGPSEAKTELKKRLEKARLGERITGVEAADRMTDPQIAAKVRQHFTEAPR
jgi:hypothetical protein